MKGIVTSLMQTAVATLPLEATAADAEARLIHQKDEFLPVLDGRFNCLGIVKERDIASIRRHAVNLFDIPVLSICKPAEHHVSPQCSIEQAMDIMQSNDIYHLLVLEGTRFCGVVSIMDVLKTIRSRLRTQEALDIAERVANQLGAGSSTTIQ